MDDGRYCPDCKAIILKTLKSVPKAVEKIWIPVEGEERDAVLAHRKAVDNAPRPEIPENATFADALRACPRPRQIAPGLYDPTTGASMDVRVVHLNRVEYFIYTWTDNREPVTVSKVMERNLETGVEVPWKNLY